MYINIRRFAGASMALAFGVALAGCQTTSSHLPLATATLPDGSKYVLAGQTRQGLTISSREATAFHCIPGKCVPVPFAGGTTQGLSGIVASAVQAGGFVAANSVLPGSGPAVINSVRATSSGNRTTTRNNNTQVFVPTVIQSSSQTAVH